MNFLGGNQTNCLMSKKLPAKRSLHCVMPDEIVLNAKSLAKFPLRTEKESNIQDFVFINGGGILERIVFPGKYAMEMSSVAYKD